MLLIWFIRDSRDGSGRAAGRRRRSLCACSSRRAARRRSWRCGGSHTEKRACRVLGTPLRPSVLSGRALRSECGGQLRLPPQARQFVSTPHITGAVGGPASVAAPNANSRWPNAHLLDLHPIRALTSTNGGGGCTAIASAINVLTTPSICPMARFLSGLRFPLGSMVMATFDICHLKIGCPP